MSHTYRITRSRHSDSAQIDILFIGYGDWHLWNWDGFRTRSAQLCRSLAHSPYVRNVYVLNEPLYLRSSPKGFNIPRLQRFQTLPLRSRCYQLEKKIYGIDPSRFLLAPFSWRKGYVLRILRKHLQEKNLCPVLWIANVPMAYLMDNIPCSLKIFDAIDDWEFIPGLKKNLKIRECYETIAARSDIIFTVSEYLATKFQQKTSTRFIRHIPNGVDLELFCYPAEPPQMRRRYRKQRQPVLTYVGVLSSRFDFEIAEAVAHAYPNCKLLLVGPLHNSEESRFKPLQSLTNVEWKGLVHHGHIPHILRGSDVLLIPHHPSHLALSMDPLKLYEYMTTGLPIVTTDVPPMNKYQQWIYIAKDIKSFIEKLNVALHEQETSHGESMWKARIEESKRHSWENRAELIINNILEKIAITC